MADTKTLSPEILLNIARTHNLPMSGLVAVIEGIQCRCILDISYGAS
jgi:hypothetical protein